MLFDILYGWRKWRGQRGIWLVLILSLCLFCSLVGFVSNILWLLSSDRPQWVGQKSPLVTIANQDSSGNLQPISAYDIELLQSLPNVKAVTSIALGTTTITLGLKEISGVRVGFYSENTFEVLGLPAPFSAQSWRSKQALLSAQFWQEHFEQEHLKQEHAADKPLSEQMLYYKGQAVPIAAVAPASMAKLGDSPIDLWLPDSYLLYEAEEMLPGKPELYVKSKSNRYGFAELSTPVFALELQQAYGVLRQQTPRPQGGFTDIHYTAWLIDGLELKPNEREALQKQAWVLLLLLGCFSFIIFSGIVSAYMQQGIVREPEMQLKVALGGDKPQLLRQLFCENLPSIILLVIASPLLGFALTEYAANIAVYRAYFDGGLAFNFGLWLVAFMGSTLLFLICAQLPMLGAMKTLFVRGQRGQMKKAQVRVSQLTLVLQLTVIIAVISLCLTLSYKEWQKYQRINLSPSLHSFAPKVTGRLSLTLSADQLAGNWPLAGENVALASMGFTDLGAQQLSYQGVGNAGIAKPVHSLYVSGNFFELLVINEFIPATLSADTIMVNHTMALQLAKELALPSWREVKGEMLTITGFYYEKQFQVAGVVEDQLHFGLNQGAKPVMYLHLSAQNPLFANRIAPVIYSKNSHPQLVGSLVNDWAVLQSTKLSYHPSEQLNQQIVDTDSAGQLLFVTSSAMAVMICLLVVFTLYYRFHFSAKVQQIKWAILLALGGQKNQLMWQTIRLNLILTSIAAGCSVLLFMLFESYSLSLLGVSLLQPKLWAVSLAICTLAIVTITMWTSKWLLRHSISRLLRE